jgi:hypothetical protein
LTVNSWANLASGIGNRPQPRRRSPKMQPHFGVVDGVEGVADCVQPEEL